MEAASPLDDMRPAKRIRLSPSNGDDQFGTLSGDSNEPAGVHQLTEADREKEVRVGITAFVSSSVPFQGILKKRYTDFLVNEILPNGEVVHLTATQISENLKVQNKHQSQPEAQDLTPNATVVNGSRATEAESTGDAQHEMKETDESGQENVRISNGDKLQLVSYLGERAVSELLSLWQSIHKHPEWKGRDHPLVRTEFTNDRSLRGQIHSAIRTIFSSKIDSSTDKDGTLVLTATNPKSSSARENRRETKPSFRPGKLGWAERGGEYLHFTLYKENKDTMEVISWLTRCMKVQAKVFQFAGTKDRRAVTTQRVSAFRIDADRLASQNRTLRSALVGDFRYHPAGLDLGDLSGNEFTITIRDMDMTGVTSTSSTDKLDQMRSSLTDSLSNLHKNGFLNYYGLQRFGTFATRTDTTGLHILQSDFAAACKTILSYSTASLPPDGQINSTTDTRGTRNFHDDTARALALHIFNTTENAQKALELLPRKFNAESMLLRHLQKQRDDHLGALMMIPRNLRLMYVHAYQSLVWNAAVTKRWLSLGAKVVPGDLILVSEHKGKQSQEPQQAEVDGDGEIIIRPAEHDQSTSADDKFERARPLTAAEAGSGHFSIFDIVLPLPGYDIEYPDNEVRQFYIDFMAQNGGLNPFDMRRKQKDFSLSGSYRKILGRIEAGWECSVHAYTQDEEQFVKTDNDTILEKEGKNTASRTGLDGACEVTENGDRRPVRDDPKEVRLEDEDGKYENGGGGGVRSEGEGEGEGAEASQMKIAAVLKFKLGSSQYATMALRELSRGGIVTYKYGSGIGA